MRGVHFDDSEKGRMKWFDEGFDEGLGEVVDIGVDGEPITKPVANNEALSEPDKKICDERSCVVRFIVEDSLSKDFAFKVEMEFSSLKQFKDAKLEHNMEFCFQESFDKTMQTVHWLRWMSFKAQVFKEEYPDFEHIFCLRHLYANFKKKFGGGTLFRDLMMAAAKATYFEAHKSKMLMIKEGRPKGSVNNGTRDDDVLDIQPLSVDKSPIKPSESKPSDVKVFFDK
ncbi:hypothetical protein KIW84_053938 [Lathyrus oleraceus]|uniref:Uncharacterized protein n=1 Tax=Pisum sativum TaxID=3888 RepID=A0A9D5AJG9_PEA|nr:hypothetical protein KIW84_053938 [Pisum sativum]